MSKRSFRLDRRAVLVAGVSTLGLSACSGIIGPPEPSPLYMLSPALPPAGGALAPWQLSVVLPEAADSIDTTRIVLVHQTGQLDYFADSSWQDRLSFLVQAALVEAFESSGRVTGVGRDTQGLRSDYLLLTDIRNFEARYAVDDTPPTVEVRLAVKLIGARSRAIAQSLIAQAEVPAVQNNVPSIVAAFNQALADVLAQIVNWAAQAPVPPPPPPQ
ncbi:MAG TPA: ABC-type transport auxiliary lipoprotein family protein [Rhizomicrobium sp.]